MPGGARLADARWLIPGRVGAAGGWPGHPGTRVAAPAYYCRLADPDETYLRTSGGEEPASAWDRHWFDAIGYDVGKPAIYLDAALSTLGTVYDSEGVKMLTTLSCRTNSTDPAAWAIATAGGACFASLPGPPRGAPASFRSR